MKLRRTNLAAITFIALGFGGCTSEPSESVTPTTPGLKAFIGARIIIDGSRVVESGVIIVQDGRITEVGEAETVTVPADAERVDLTGRVVVPGFINTHGHVGATRGLESSQDLYTRDNLLRQLDLYARYGVTTVFSLGNDDKIGLDLRDEQNANPLSRARLFVAGPVLNPSTPEEARIAVDEVANMGVDIVKIRVDDNLGSTTKMPEAVYRAVIDQAHEHGLRVAAHLFYLDDAKALVKAGVDFLAHSIRDVDVDQELIDLMVEQNICLTPTLLREVSTFVYESRPNFFDDPFFLQHVDPDVLTQLEDPERQVQVQNSSSAQQYKAALDIAMRNVKALADGGVRIAFGTDTGPVGRFQGYFEQLELERMVDAGLTAEQVLVTATRDAAACMQTEDVGTLEAGKWADLLVLSADPLDDILNTRAIESVWIAGNQIPALN